jgi:hypothetical protein
MLAFGDDLLLPLVTLLRKQETRKVRHLNSLGLRKFFANLDEFRRLGAHV